MKTVMDFMEAFRKLCAEASVSLGDDGYRDFLDELGAEIIGYEDALEDL